MVRYLLPVFSIMHAHGPWRRSVHILYYRPKRAGSTLYTHTLFYSLYFYLMKSTAIPTATHSDLIIQEISTGEADLLTPQSHKQYYTVTSPTCVLDLWRCKGIHSYFIYPKIRRLGDVSYLGVLYFPREHLVIRDINFPGVIHVLRMNTKSCWLVQ